MDDNDIEQFCEEFFPHLPCSEDNNVRAELKAVFGQLLQAIEDGAEATPSLLRACFNDANVRTVTINNHAEDAAVKFSAFIKRHQNAQIG